MFHQHKLLLIIELISLSLKANKFYIHKVLDNKINLTLDEHLPKG
jgi:hypothetical protein